MDCKIHKTLLYILGFFGINLNEPQNSFCETATWQPQDVLVVRIKNKTCTFCQTLICLWFTHNINSFLLWEWLIATQQERKRFASLLMTSEIGARDLRCWVSFWFHIVLLTKCCDVLPHSISSSHDCHPHFPELVIYRMHMFSVYWLPSKWNGNNCVIISWTKNRGVIQSRHCGFFKWSA